jgi:hypothetical protein
MHASNVLVVGRLCVVHDEERKYENFTQSDDPELAILWGGAMLLVGLIHLAAPSYGGDFLQIMSSVYPSADTAPSLRRVLLGTLYGFVDGGGAGLVFAWLYCAFAGSTSAVAK